MPVKEEKKTIVTRTRKKASEEPKKASKSTKKEDKVETTSVAKTVLEKAQKAVLKAEEPAVENVNPEVPEEAVVPADLSDMVETPKHSGLEKINTEKGKELSDIGTKSDDILEQESKVLSRREIDDKNYRDLLRYQRSGEILWGEVDAVEEHPGAQLKNAVIISVLYNGVKILIPDIAYFEDSFSFGANYASMTDRQKFEKRRTMAEYQKGARVCFVLKAVQRTQIKGGDFDGEYEIHCVGSRKEAMEILRDIWFLHKNRKDTSREPRSVSIGDIAKAHVVSVREEYAVVECLGVETRIDAYNLNNEIVENCNDFVVPGDTINVRVKKLHVGGDNVYLTVSGRLNDPSKLINSMFVNSSYLGTVDSYNERKDLYTILLKNGVQASVRASQVEGGIELYPGDRVSVRVKDIRPTYVVGNAIKL